MFPELLAPLHRALLERLRNSHLIEEPQQIRQSQRVLLVVLSIMVRYAAEVVIVEVGWEEVVFGVEGVEFRDAGDGRPHSFLPATVAAIIAVTPKEIGGGLVGVVVVG